MDLWACSPYFSAGSQADSSSADTIGKYGLSYETAETNPLSPVAFVSGMRYKRVPTQTLKG